MQHEGSKHNCKYDEIRQKRKADIFDFIDAIHNFTGNWIHKAFLILILTDIAPHSMSHLHYVKRHLTRWLHALFTRQIEPNDKGLVSQYIT